MPSRPPPESARRAALFDGKVTMLDLVQYFCAYCRAWLDWRMPIFLPATSSSVLILESLGTTRALLPMMSGRVKSTGLRRTSVSAMDPIVRSAWPLATSGIRVSKSCAVIWTSRPMFFAASETRATSTPTHFLSLMYANGVRSLLVTMVRTPGLMVSNFEVALPAEDDDPASAPLEQAVVVTSAVART